VVRVNKHGVEETSWSDPEEDSASDYAWWWTYFKFQDMHALEANLSGPKTSLF